MAQKQDIPLTVQHEVVKRGGKIRFRKFRKGGYEHFLIRLWIEGPLQAIKSVEYELHPAFKDPIRSSKDRKNGFSIECWTWGEFDVLVTVHFSDGDSKVIEYYLEYSSELPSDADAYVDESSKEILEAS